MTTKKGGRPNKKQLEAQEKSESKKTSDKTKSKATKIETPFYKRKIESARQPLKTLLKIYYWIIQPNIKIQEFEKPLLMLIRNTGKVDFYDNASEGLFKYKHSNGREKEQELLNDKLLTFNYGDAKKGEKFNGYILDENALFPLPENPIVDAEYTQMIIDKTLADIKDWKSKEIATRLEGYQKILLTLFVGIAIVAGAEWLTQGAITGMIKSVIRPEPIINATKTIAENITQNITIHP